MPQQLDLSLRCLDDNSNPYNSSYFSFLVKKLSVKINLFSEAMKRRFNGFAPHGEGFLENPVLSPQFWGFGELPSPGTVPVLQWEFHQGIPAGSLGSLG